MVTIKMDLIITGKEQEARGQPSVQSTWGRKQQTCSLIPKSQNVMTQPSRPHRWANKAENVRLLVRHRNLFWSDSRKLDTGQRKG